MVKRLGRKIARAARRLFKIIRECIKAWNEDQAERLAAALSYYAIFSLAPSLIIVIGLTGLLIDQERVEDEIVAEIHQVMGEDVANFVDNIMNERRAIGSENNLLVTLLGVGTVMFGASGAFAQLQGALNTIWHVRAKPKRGFINFIRTRLFSFVILLMIGFMLLLSLVVNTWLVLIDDWLRAMMPNLHLVFNQGNIIISFAVTMLLFALLYKIMPDVHIRWHDTWVGAAVASFLFNIGKWVLGLYLGSGMLLYTFGAAGALVVLLVWVYYSAQIVLFGAEFIKIFATQRGRGVLPASHAIHVRWRREDVIHPD